nr:ubiquitin-like-specific protease 1D [Malus domestica]
MEEETGRKRRIDVSKVLDSLDDSGDPLERVVLPESKRKATAAEEQPPKQSGMGGGDQQRDYLFEDIGDRELEEKIKRQKSNIEKLSRSLPDKGEKLRVALMLLEDEKERRRCSLLEKNTSRWEELAQATSCKNRNMDDSTGFKNETAAPLAKPKSEFACHFEQKMEEKSDSRTASETQTESSLLPCNRQSMKSNGKLLQKGGRKGRSSSRYVPRQCSSSFNHKQEKCSPSNGGHKGGASFPCSLRHVAEDLSSCGRNWNDASQINGSRHQKGQTVVEILDEEDAEPADTAEQEEELPEGISKVKIYYPSRNDPKSVEICYADIGCLDPEGYLTSTIMNFYIRYLQQQTSPTDRALHNFHFFNTFFYEKLKEDVAYKGDDKDSKALISRIRTAFFVYNKKIKTTPIPMMGVPRIQRLVAGSERLLSGRRASDIPKILLEEKLRDFLSDHGASLWSHRRNEYDCGLFVLFFMERFIEEAPERLKMKDLSMRLVLLKNEPAYGILTESGAQM